MADIRLQGAKKRVEALGEHAVLYTQMAGAVLAKTTQERVRVGDALPISLPSGAWQFTSLDAENRRWTG